MPLVMVQAGRTVRFVGVQAGRALQARLAALGMVPGTQIEVVNPSLRGPFLVSVKGSRIMLGRGVAHKILVE